ncbi:RecJ-like exonuclease, contains DnaJ-type Zn finger domain [Natronoarchaeum philippinense]|uniref:RecJ-like exonuclease, contains DnaJ-type Zn finger domain n=1 Tax=Natronoarchaeum philippinense TaxID=558529 RepID=A0A285NAK9_NATPI|nr:OB-fold nucleic acid binding domain-containing protein [Natronoarchaeum philippinense]SNZ05943.1 RecJ-like exonuclease, contains DnaJ-type Zn finger domain [Natronoarchaeum philippinense]
MGNCIICGAPVDGLVCSTHQEDVAFEFEGDSPEQLTANRYYRGSVDGFADFGVFVDIGDAVTGLLHRSELDRRLDSLDWDSGDEVYVKVKSVRDNGDIDLGWSIRQSADEFRGTLVDTPEGDIHADEESSAGNANSADATPNGGHVATVDTDDASDSESDADAAASDAEDEQPTSEAEQSATEDEQSAAEDEQSAAEDDQPTADSDDVEAGIDRTAIESLGELVGEDVRIEGEVVGVRQTSGPTIFELRDETGVIECAAFEEAGVRAYPDIEIDDAVRLDGEVERRRDELQVETETLLRLEGEEAAAVEDRLQSALDDAAAPEAMELLAGHDDVAAIEGDLEAAATAIRRAILEARPIVVRHSATADGYAGGAAIERAALPLIREEHSRQDAVYNYFQRRPIEGHIYDMDAATSDVTDMLEDRERHGDQLPLVVLVDAGSTVESEDGYDLLDVYDVETVVVDAHAPDDAAADAVDTFANPGSDDVTTPALAANVAAAVNEDVREEMYHVPAVGYWEEVPDAYAALAAEAGYAADPVREIREAIALEAYYQTYKDKRELIADLLFEKAEGLAGHVSGQFRTKLDGEIETAERNLTIREANGVTFTVLDTDAFTHRFDFPNTTLLVDALHRHQRDEQGAPLVTLGVDEDEIHVRSTESVDVRDIGDAAAERADEAGVSVVGGRDGHVEFLAGQRDAVLEAVVASIASEL